MEHAMVHQDTPKILDQQLDLTQLYIEFICIYSQ
jgi:hypothetical protein